MLLSLPEIHVLDKPFLFTTKYMPTYHKLAFTAEGDYHMGLSKVQIQLQPERQFPPHTNLSLGQTLAKKLGIEHPSIIVKFGSSVGAAYLWLTNQKNSILQCSQQLAEQLLIPPTSSMYARFDNRTIRLRIGPLLGILIDAEPSNQSKNPFGMMTKFFEECSIVGKKHGIQVAILSPQALSIAKKQMQTWIFQENKWIKAILPLPDVIYNRITSRRVESKKDLQSKLNILRTFYRIPIFNETFLDKLQVHRLLSRDVKTAHMLPETHIFQKQQLKKMLFQYPILYLKPSNGSLGKGIIRLVRRPYQIFYQSSTANGTITLKFRSIAECIKAVSARIGRQSYIIQRGLDLATFGGRQLDFRVLAQKNHWGSWSITSMVARIANNQHFVSNLARGGTIRKASDVIKELHLPKKPTISKLKTIALTIAQTFEQLAQGHFAELGIDLALDKKGKVWLIEINSKPSKTDDSVINPSLNARPSVIRLMNYIHYLMGIPPSKPSRTKQRKGRKQ